MNLHMTRLGGNLGRGLKEMMKGEPGDTPNPRSPSAHGFGGR